MTSNFIINLLLMFSSQNALFASKVIVRHPDQFHYLLQIPFLAHNERDVSCFRRPTVRARFVLRQDELLIDSRQSNVAVAPAMDVHEHCPSDKKGVFMDSRILPLGHTRQVENLL